MPPPPREAFHHGDADDHPCSTNTNRPLAAALSGLPALCSDEIHTGPELGQGGYCSVLAVRHVQLDPDAPTDKGLILTADAAAVRRRFMKRFGGYREAHRPSYQRVPGQPPPPVGDPTQQKPPRLALKRLKSSLNRKRHATGLADLTSEVALLAQLGGHPNIVGCYGVGYDTGDNGVGDGGDGDDGDDNEASSGNRSIAFVLLDQLRCTLKNKLYLWRERRGAGMLISRSRLNELWLERMVILMRIASAISYLHSKGVAHRDVNCDNVGFDVDDTPKLFDFGLARVVGTERLPPVTLPGDTEEVSNEEDDDARYDMTTNTGTVRYMAPEIALGEPYGLKVDVYSLAIVMHEVLSLRKPYASVPMTTFTSEVAIRGQRPPVDGCWPGGLNHILQRMWDGDGAERPPAGEVVAVLESLLRGSDEQLYPRPALHRLLAR